MNWVELMFRNQMMNPQMPSQQFGAPAGMPFPQPQAQPQMPMEESPVARGINSGMGAGRQSIQMDEAQREQALGLLIAKMFGGMAQSKNPSLLGSANEGLSGGIDAFQNEANNISNFNAYEVERQDRLAREKQRQLEKERDRRETASHRRELLSLKKQELGNKYPEISSAASMDDAVPLSSLPKNAASASYKEMQGRASSGTSLKGVLTTLEQMEKLSKENPHLGKSMAVAYYATKDGKGADSVLKNMALGKDRTAVEKFAKLSSRLVQHQIKSIKGPATDRMKQIIMQSTPTAGMTKESIDYLIETARDEAIPYYEDAIRAREGLIKGMYVPIKLDPYQMPGEESEDPAVDQFRKDFPQLSDKPAEEIKEYLRLHGKLK